MARLAALGALLMVLLAITQASTYRTIVTTEINDQDQSRSECHEQIQRIDTNPCLNVVVYMSMLQMGGQEQYCCNELQKLSQPCVCEAVQDMIAYVRQFEGPGYGGQPEVIQKRVQKAQQLPETCGFARCKIGRDEY